jgi:hypothetical protein
MSRQAFTELEDLELSIAYISLRNIGLLRDGLAVGAVTYSHLVRCNNMFTRSAKLGSMTFVEFRNCTNLGK